MQKISKNDKLNIIVLIAAMTSVICVIAPISIITPFSIVPISLSTFAIILSVYILGLFPGLASVVLYIILGFCGLPVFSGFTGGAQKVLGPTGGYIIGYIFLAIISGLFIDKFDDMRIRFFGIVLGMVILYIFGTVWLAFNLNYSFKDALFVGVIPFTIGDLIKIILAMYIGEKCKVSLNKSNFL